MTTDLAALSWIAAPETAGEIADDEQSAKRVISALRARGYQTLVFKQPFSTAGRGLRRCFADPDKEDQRFIADTLATQRAILIEPWLDRVLDLSLQLEIDARGQPRHLGLTRFLVDHRGRYRGSLVSPMQQGLTAELARFLLGDGRKEELHTIEKTLAARVAELCRDHSYEGKLGIDLFIYREHDTGALKLKPVVEINPRTTMGHIALALRPHVRPGPTALFTIHRRPQSHPQPWLAHPPIFHPHAARPLLTEGALPLADPAAATDLLPCLWVAPTLDQILSQSDLMARRSPAT